MREVVLDTETTGFKPEDGHRVVEIGCVELINHVTTGERFHVYLNPDRLVPAEATAVHGLTDAFLDDKPRFEEVVDAFLTFIDNAPLVIHNAVFDLGFLNAELKRVGLSGLPAGRAIDTLALARRKFPGAPATLDALCRRFGVDNSGRAFHGALLDAQLLAECYLELCGGRQTGLALSTTVSTAPTRESRGVERRRRLPRFHIPTADEQAAHDALVAALKAPLWRR